MQAEASQAVYGSQSGQETLGNMLCLVKFDDAVILGICSKVKVKVKYQMKIRVKYLMKTKVKYLMKMKVKYLMKMKVKYLIKIHAEKNPI